MQEKVAAHKRRMQEEKQKHHQEVAILALIFFPLSECPLHPMVSFVDCVAPVPAPRDGTKSRRGKQEAAETGGHNQVGIYVRMYIQKCK